MALPRKMLIAISSMFCTAINVTVLFWQYLCQFSLKFQLLLTSFVLVNVGNQLKVGPNAMEADDTLT